MSNWTFFDNYPRVLNAVSHDLLPVFVNRFEEPPLLRDLLHDVFRGEDGLQVKPLGLHLQPFIYGLLDTKQTLLPFLRSYNKQLKLCRILKLTLQVNNTSIYYHWANWKKNLKQTLISFSKGLMNGEPLIVWVFTIWSSSIVWMSSKVVRMETSLSL